MPLIDVGYIRWKFVVFAFVNHIENFTKTSLLLVAINIVDLNEFKCIKAPLKDPKPQFKREVFERYQTKRAR